jgi:hypothetical protein
MRSLKDGAGFEKRLDPVSAIFTAPSGVFESSPGGLRIVCHVIDHDAAGPYLRGHSARWRSVHIFEIEPTTECVKYKRFMCGLLAVAFEPAYRSKAAGIGAMGWRFAGFEVGRFSRIVFAFGFFLPPFMFVNLI